MNLPVKTAHIMILTGEPSGDLHAGALVEQIKKIHPACSFSGIGGPCLEKQGVDLFFDIESLSAMGLTEVLLQFRQIKKAFDAFKQRLRFRSPDLIVLVDYPGFNLKAAEYAKENSRAKILYYITPKVWAWKKSRLFKIKKVIDHCALILPFEEMIYKKAGIPATYVGNPLVDAYSAQIPEKPLAEITHKATQLNRPLIIGLLPGSRKTELLNLLPIMLKSASQISENRPNTQFLLSQAGSVRTDILKQILDKEKNGLSVQIQKGPVKQVLQEADLVIAASGTVTLEAALLCVPTIIIYRMSFLSYQIAKRVIQVKYAGLPNLIADQEVMPELLQDEATPEKICRESLHMMDRLSDYQKKLMPVRQRLGKTGASKRTAGIAVRLLRQTGIVDSA